MHNYNSTKNAEITQAWKKNSNALDKPKSLKVNPNTIPSELRTLNQWVVWKWEYRKGKWTKPPYQPARPHFHAESDKPETWSDFATAWRVYANGHADGLGFVFTTQDPYCGVDLDGCRDATTGAIAEWAQEHIGKLDTYTEVSPSGTGVKMLTRAKLPGKGRKKGEREIYDHLRYFTVTGNPVPDCPGTIQDRQEAASEFYNLVRPDENDKTTTTSPDEPVSAGWQDDDLLDRARTATNGDKFVRLWKGDWDGYPSQSEADMALCSLLAFWVGNDPDRIDGLFRRSGLYRDKWDRDDYRERTITQALSGAEFFQGDDLPQGYEAQIDAALRKNQPRKPVLTWDELEDLPEPSWQLTNHFHEQSFTVLFGDPGTYKSFLAMDWAFCTGTARPFQSCYDVIPGAVWYVCSEGFNTAKLRGKAWAKHHATPIAHNYLAGGSHDLTSLDNAKRLTDFFIEVSKTTPKLFVIDTLNANFGAGDENASKDMTSFVRSVRWLQENLTTAVVVIHHRGKDASKGARGHSVLRGAADTMIEVERVKNTDRAIHVLCHKQKDAEPFPDYILHTKKISLDTLDNMGRPKTSIVLVGQDHIHDTFHFLSKAQKDLLCGLWQRHSDQPFRFSDGQALTSSSNYKRLLTGLREKNLIHHDGKHYKVNAEVRRLFVE